MTYQVKIEGGGLILERDVSEEIGRQIVVLIMTEGQTRALPGEPGPQEGVPESPAEMARGDTDHSIGEYLLAHNAKRNPDKIAAIGLFIKDIEGRKTFTRDDILRKFEEAAEPVPKNLARDIKWTRKNRWIAPKTGQKDTYYITGTGMGAVKAKFPKETRKKTSSGTKPRQRKANGEKAKE